MTPQSHRPSHRRQRVGDQIQQALSELLITKINDPRLHRVAITEVKLSADMANAIVFVTAASDQPHKNILYALTHASGFLRKELASLLNLRITPKLRFSYDTAEEQANRLDHLLKDISLD